MNPQKQLVYIATGQPVKLKDRTQDFRGDACTVVGWSAPRRSDSTGRVTLNYGSGWQEYFPSVINAEWREIDQETNDMTNKITSDYSLIEPSTVARTQKDIAADDRKARALVRGKGTFHSYLFRQIPTEVEGQCELKIIATYVDANGALQTTFER